jgi:hypothetical protein
VARRQQAFRCPLDNHATSGVLGEGENLLGGLNLPALGYECVERVEGARATHVTLRKKE